MYNYAHLVSGKMLLYKGLASPCLDRTGVALLKLRRHGGILGAGGREADQREGGRERKEQGQSYMKVSHTHVCRSLQ